MFRGISNKAKNDKKNNLNQYNFGDLNCFV